MSHRINSCNPRQAGHHTKVRDLKVVDRPIDSIKPYESNPRKHSRKQIRQLADSIRQFGFTNPVLIDADGGIIAGHGRVAAAQLLDMECVPTIRIDHLSEAEKRAYVLADNKLAENAGWDRGLLALELAYIAELDLDFDVTITGFKTDEIDLLIQEMQTGDSDPEADNVPPIDPAIPAVSGVGDLWHLGNHRLLCGDATDADAYRRLMAGRKAQMAFTDPPYNVAIDGHAGGLGAIRHREFLMASGEMSEAEFTAFLTTALRLMAINSIRGSIHYVCMDWRHAYELLTAGRVAYTEVKNLCVWNKNNGGMGSFYRSKHELVFVFKSGSGAHINNFELGQNGRYRTNVWDYAGVNTLRDGRREELQMHPTVKPVAMVADAIIDCSRRGGIVLDCFAGSGTTLIAAQKTGRKAYAMELDPHYVDTAIRRWQTLTGLEAVHAESGRTFRSKQAASCPDPSAPIKANRRRSTVIPTTAENPDGR
jgi:DNA modification methylase